MILKKEKNKLKGFTLVELLAVIVILAIILVIAVPKIMSVIEDSKKATFESTAKMIASQAEKRLVQNTILGKEDEITCDSVAQINKIDYESCNVEFDGDEALVTMTGNGKFDGYYVCYGTKTAVNVQNEPCSGTETAEACFQYEVFYDVNVASKTSCLNYMRPIMVDLYGYSEEDLNTFCSGNKMDFMTFSQHINKMIHEEETTIEELISNGVVTDVKEVVEITGYDKTCGTSVNVPRKIDNKPVYGIGHRAFVATGITSVNLPTSLRYIGYQAFISSTSSNDGYGSNATGESIKITGDLDLSNLTNLTTIMEDAFYGNEITSIKLPTSINDIVGGAFAVNKSLTTIINPSGKSFDWYSVTDQGTDSTCTFVTGTCGSITIKAS